MHYTDVAVVAVVAVDAVVAALADADDDADSADAHAVDTAVPVTINNAALSYPLKVLPSCMI